MNGGARLRRALIQWIEIRAREDARPTRFMESPLSFFACIGTMNRCASQRRGPDRGSATRSLLGSWRADRVFNRRCAATVRFAAPALKPALIAAVLLNWIYLCLTLP